MAGSLALHDVADARAFVTAIAGPYAQRHGLSYHDAEDLDAYLLACCWQLSLDYRPGRLSFSTWAGTTLRRRLIDFERKRNGRTVWKFRDRVHTRTRPQLLPLDVGAVDAALAARAGDSPPGGDEELPTAIRRER